MTTTFERARPPATVFISSTVKDLRDLRSGAKYLLEEYGFSVLTSEVNDFEHALDRDAAAASIAAMDRAQFYVLFVGFRYGSVINDISVTHAEYRHARELASAGGMQLVLLVRRRVSDLWRAHVTDVPESGADWSAVGGFLDEIRRPMRDVSNWVHEFDSFRDVADVLRATLRLSGPLRRRALESALLWELRQNIKKAIYARRGRRPLVISNLFNADTIPEPKPTELNQSFEIDQSQAGRLAHFNLLAPSGVGGFERTALAAAIESGEFLAFDASVSSFRVGPLQEALLDLGERLRQFESAVDYAHTAGQHQESMAGVIAQARRGATGTTPVSGHTLRVLFVARNQLHNITSRLLSIARLLTGLDSELAMPLTADLIRPGDEVSPEDDRDATDEEVDEFLLNGTMS